MTPARYIGSGILPTAIDVNDALLAAIVLVAGETLSIPFCVTGTGTAPRLIIRYRFVKIRP